MGNSASPKTNAYSGNNGRAAILNNSGGADLLYTAGNAGNGSDPQPDRNHHCRRRANLLSLERAGGGARSGAADACG